MDAATVLEAPLRTDTLRPLRSGQRVLVRGVIYTARDAAHARMAEEVARGGSLPFDSAGSILYFVGPTPAKPRRPIGSAGPTTASRMDRYAPLLLARGLRAMIGKGRRSGAVRAAMIEHGCIYLGAVEGTAALLARSVRSAEVIAYADLGTEAIRRLVVEDFPTVVVNDLDGGDLYRDGPARWRAVSTRTGSPDQGEYS